MYTGKLACDLATKFFISGMTAWITIKFDNKELTLSSFLRI
jgi:hypothetical protein